MEDPGPRVGVGGAHDLVRAVLGPVDRLDAADLVVGEGEDLEQGEVLEGEGRAAQDLAAEREAEGDEGGAGDRDPAEDPVVLDDRGRFVAAEVGLEDGRPQGGRGDPAPNERPGPGGLGPVPPPLPGVGG